MPSVCWPVPAELAVCRPSPAHLLAGCRPLTLPSYFENRFNDTSRILRVVCAFFILLFFLFYTSSGLVAGKLFETVFGPTTTSLSLWAHWLWFPTPSSVVSWRFPGHVIQGLLMFAALLLVPIIAMNAAGGWTQPRLRWKRRTRNF